MSLDDDDDDDDEWDDNEAGNVSSCIQCMRGIFEL
jgi:hypothetical protein